MRLALIDLDTMALINTQVDFTTQAKETEKLFDQLSANYLFLLSSYLESYRHIKIKEISIECVLDNANTPLVLKTSKKFATI